MINRLLSYESIVGAPAISQIRQLAAPLEGASVVHVNSTRVGGGVAEILAWLVPMMQELGLDVDWEVVTGNAAFFDVTKTFHNGLQGKPVPLPSSMIQAYEEVSDANAERLRDKLEAADFVIIHDPQPARLLKLCPNRKGMWVWRCHIDASHPNRRIWNYLRQQVEGYNASIFSMPSFAKSLPHPQFIIAPSIDPLSDKNRDLEDTFISQTLERHGIPNDAPLITQVSRFDRFKDPIGVIEGFKLLNSSTDAHLVLAGGGATDDPEGQAVYDEVIEAADADPRIHVLLLPGDAHREINALQRASVVVVQKSLQEGFGLTVTEAMWKGKPVIGGNAGGIRLQVYNHYTGFLVESPQGMALRIRELLRHPRKRSRMGATAKQLVTENFLLVRHLREYLTLMLGVRSGLANHLVAQ